MTTVIRLVSLLDYRPLNELLECLRTHIVHHDGGRRRIEVRAMTPAHLLAKFILIETACPKCGVTVHPIRQREGAWTGSSYAKVSCSVKCRNSQAARVEFAKIVAAIEGWQDPTQPLLFGEMLEDDEDDDYEFDLPVE